MKDYICKNTEYFYGNGYIAISIEIADLPKTFEINKKILLLKSLFHMSLVFVKGIVLKYGEESEQKVIDFFCDFVKDNKISFSNYKNEFRYVIDERGRETVIIMCDVLNIKEFFESLNKEFGFEIEIPPVHITLYTLQQDLGIGLNNSEDIEEKTKIITGQIHSEIKERLISL
jgi:hypothetical protein